jgi:hypothetical protein
MRNRDGRRGRRWSSIIKPKNLDKLKDDDMNNISFAELEQILTR